MSFSLKGAKFKTIKDLVKRASPQELAKGEVILAREMEKAVTQIIARTQSGKNVDGNPFKAYSESYGKWKRDVKGRHLTPDLTLTGRMLGAIRTTIKRLRNGVLEGRIFILSQEADKAKWNQKTRKFFGLSDEQKAKLDKIMKGIFSGER